MCTEQSSKKKITTNYDSKLELKIDRCNTTMMTLIRTKKNRCDVPLNLSMLDSLLKFENVMI